MKKIFLLLLLLCLAPLSQTQAQATRRTVAVQAQIEANERQRFAAQVSKDYTFLDKIFSDDLVYIHSSGKVDSKASYIQSIKDGKSVYEKIDVEEIKVRVYNQDKTALVNGVILITSTPKEDGSPNLSHVRYVVVYIKDRQKGWQLVSWQSLKLSN